MDRCDDIYALQCAQLEHDERFHRDIVVLPPAERLKHMALHHAKYAGYLVDAIDNQDDLRIKRILTDAFIITLATANSLNQDLSLASDGTCSDQHPTTLGRRLAGKLTDSTNDSIWLLKEFVRRSGQLAKACEAWDHMENLQFLSQLRECNLGLFELVVAAASLRHLDLGKSYGERIQEVESKSIFYRRYRADAPGTQS